ncbi:ABC-F family ATP-binding cassette domain-containing protein [Bosea sp. F3-2]|uniref:ABC-F family ATP-binding cassette domain-containing protein n=1 Tax=Bosea sp. F3-2 TaxID=2599640 RepID=UPI0011EF67A9|nr:ABC-F family ATP-binding cassette domain-containing protein [Bosea sp. F3-2]QEL26601.1 ABC-F family ATP-binding cassette domain-containing protein [Bosea sp. F3-2]
MVSISASDLSWTTPDGRFVLKGLDLQLGRERVGLVGRNGVGKTTLLQLLAGKRSGAGGSVTIDGRVCLMRQDVQVAVEATIADLFGVRDALAVLRRAELGTASVEELGEADWTLEERMRQAFAQVELDVDGSTLLRMLSGGQQTRARLAAAIFEQPDFIFLDEPTNNLDREGRGALLRFVDQWTMGLVAASHDRELLEKMDAIIELTTIGASRYGGNWSQYMARKAVELEAAEHDLADAQKRRADTERKAQLANERKARRDAAGSRKAARGDIPRILTGARKNAAQASGGSGARLNEKLSVQAAEAVTAAQAKMEVLQRLSIALPPTGLHADRRVLELLAVAAGYERERPLLEGLELTIVGPERVALAGRNGIGKSTVLKVVSGALTPLAGQVRVGTPTVMVDQQVSFLDPARSILANFRVLNPEANENMCRSALASFLFRADAALQTVGTLSGGQMLRAGLACRLGGPRPPQFLILDEPTNHLDIESVTAIEAALATYDGALLVVSHDGTFLRNISIQRIVDLDAITAHRRGLEDGLEKFR